MSVGTTDLMARITSSAAFTTAVGNNTHSEGETITEFLSFDGNGNNVEVRDSDNETFKLSLANLADELGMSVEQLKADLGIDTLEGAEGAGKTEGTTEAAAVNGTSSEAIQKEIDDLNADKQESMETLKALETTIKDLSETIEKKLEEAAKKQEIRIEEHQEEVEKAIANNVENYINASKNGKPMSKDQLQSNIKSSIAGIEGIPTGADDVISNLFTINSELGLLDANLSKVKNLTDHVRDIDCQLETKGTELEAAKQAEEAAAAKAKSCDPIGFQMATADGQSMQVDFFVDRDGDGTITDASEFLGAVADAEGKDGWSEMQALNTDGNDVIDSDELKANDQLKVMVTIGDEQKAMSIAEFEAQYGDIEINANKDAQTNTAVGPNNFDDNKYNNQRLGSFGLTIGGQDLSGYQTKDDMDYLNDNYNFSSGSAEGVNGAGLLQAANGAENAEGIEAVDGVEVSEELQHFEDFYNTYSEQAKQLRQQLENLWTIQGLNEEYINLIDNSAFVVAENQVKDVKTENEDGAEATEGENENETGVDAVGETEGANNKETENEKQKKEKALA